MAKSRTPLPVVQLSVLLLLRFCEAASALAMFPFINQLLLSITGDEETVGYYAGVMEATRQLTSLLVVMYWSRLSDHVGRKPILLLGTAALALSMFCFGLSKTFIGLVLSRCVFTALNSNAGVIKGVIGEITDSSNSADAFALLHAPWALGASIGPLIGGSLASPHDRFPSSKMFAGAFWQKYPYFLPCAAISALTVGGLLVLLVGFRETVPGTFFFRYQKRSRRHSIEDEDEDLETSQPLLGPSPFHTPNPASSSSSPPLRLLLTPHILLPILNYTFLAFLHTASNCLQPLFLGMSLPLGGLGLPPTQIGYILGAYGALNSVFQAGVLGRVVRRWGVRRVFGAAVGALVPMFALVPAMNLLAVREGEVGGGVWVLLGVWVGLSLVMELGYGCIYMYITDSAPSKLALGATNGLAQTLVAVARIAAPILSSSLLSFSIQHNILHGYAAYAFLGVLAVGGMFLAGRLPEILRADPEGSGIEDEDEDER